MQFTGIASNIGLLQADPDNSTTQTKPNFLDIFLSILVRLQTFQYLIFLFNNGKICANARHLKVQGGERGGHKNKIIGLSSEDPDEMQ